MTKRYLLLFAVLFGLSWQMKAQNYADKTISQGDYKIIKTTASSRTEDYINFLSLLGIPGNPEEREKFMQKALDLLENSSTVVVNDLDPNKSTTENFKAKNYLRNILSFYPEGVNIFSEGLQVSQVFYDEKEDRYFVKATVTRSLEGKFKGEKAVQNTQKLDFYIKFYQGKEKSSTRIYLVDEHRENLHKFSPVRIVDDRSSSTSLFSDEEKKRLKKEKEKALEENQQLKNQLSSISMKLDEEARKRREAERKARVALREADKAQKEVEDIKNRSNRMNKKLRAALREEQEIYDKAKALVRDYDYLMDKKTVRGRIHRAGYDKLRYFDTKSILYFNQIPTFKVLNEQPRWDASEARELQRRLVKIYDKTQETMQKSHKVSLSKKYQRYREKDKKLFIKLGYAMAAYSDDFEGLIDGPIIMYRAQLALRAAKPGNKRGTLIGVYGTYGQISPSYFGATLDNPNPSWDLEGPDDLGFYEAEFGFTIRELWRISGGYGSIEVPIGANDVANLEYYPVTTGLSVSFFRFLEIDVFGSALLGNDNIPMDKFRVGAAANIIIKL